MNLHTAFKDKVALITGGASGIGLAFAEVLAEAGAQVFIADLQLEAAESVVAGITAKGGRAEAVALDVRDAEAFADWAQQVKVTAGRIDYFFNNAGICITGAVRDYSLQDWRALVDINVMGVINGIQAVYPLMIEQGFGHIVNTASMAGVTPSAGLAGYSATKHAVVGLSTALRIEAEFEGVDVSVLCPGAIRTPLLASGGKFGKQLSNLSEAETLAFWERMRPMDIHVFARKALRDVVKKRAFIIYPAWYRILWWVIRLSPLIIMKQSGTDFKQQHIDSRK